MASNGEKPLQEKERVCLGKGSVKKKKTSEDKTARHPKTPKKDSMNREKRKVLHFWKTIKNIRQGSYIFEKASKIYDKRQKTLWKQRYVETVGIERSMASHTFLKNHQKYMTMVLHF